MLTISQTTKLLAECYRSRDCVVPHLIGVPGIGKTQSIDDFAKSIDARVFHYYLSQANPTEVTGITMPDGSSRTMCVYDHRSLKEMKDGDILFLDEFLQASPQVMNAALTLIQERRMASGRMLPDVMICASSNPPSSPSSIPLNIRQRFLFTEVKFDRDEWVDYLCRKYGESMRMDFDELANAVHARATSSSWVLFTPRMIEKIFRLLINAYDFETTKELLVDNDSVYSGNVMKVAIAARAYIEKRKTSSILDGIEKIRQRLPEVDIPKDCTVKDLTRVLVENGLLDDPEFTEWLSTLKI